MQQIDKVYIDGAFVTPHGEEWLSSILPVASTAATVSAFFSPFLEFHPLGP